MLISGLICADNFKEIQAIAELHKEIKNDEYLKSIPSITKTNINFHAKNDTLEVREKVFKVIKKLDFKAEFIVARKRLDVFTKTKMFFIMN